MNCKHTHAHNLQYEQPLIKCFSVSVFLNTYFYECKLHVLRVLHHLTFRCAVLLCCCVCECRCFLKGTLKSQARSAERLYSHAGATFCGFESSGENIKMQAWSNVRIQCLFLWDDKSRAYLWRHSRFIFFKNLQLRAASWIFCRFWPQQLSLSCKSVSNFWANMCG